jgi:hypothetical protein
MCVFQVSGVSRLGPKCNAHRTEADFITRLHNACSPLGVRKYLFGSQHIDYPALSGEAKHFK